MEKAFFVKKAILGKPFKGRRKQMKKFSVLFSIFAVLMAVTFTSCTPEVSEEMDSFTEDMIGEWMIGTWDMFSSSKSTSVIGEKEQTTESTATGTIEFKGIEDDSEWIITFVREGEVEEYKQIGTFKDFKQMFFIETEDTENYTIDVSLNVNKERSKIEINRTSSGEYDDIEYKYKDSMSYILTKR